MEFGEYSASASATAPQDGVLIGITQLTYQPVRGQVELLKPGDDSSAQGFRFNRLDGCFDLAGVTESQ